MIAHIIVYNKGRIFFHPLTVTRNKYKSGDLIDFSSSDTNVSQEDYSNISLNTEDLRVLANFDDINYLQDTKEDFKHALPPVGFPL